MGLLQLGPFLFLTVWAYTAIAMESHEHHLHISTLMMKVEGQLEAIQTLQESIKKTLEEIRAAQSGARTSSQQAACLGNTYNLDTKSSFLMKDEIVTMNNGHSIRMDDILYGYDWVFESKRLFSAGSWLGVQNQQDPADVAAIQQLVWDIKPRVIYDIGTNVGGSAILFAHIMSQYAKPGEAIIVSVDPKHYSINWDDAAKKLCPKCTLVDTNPLWNNYVQFVQARSVEPQAVAALEAAITKYGGPVLISVDGWHDYPEVYEECVTFAKYVTVGSYMIVQDTKLDRIFNKPGPRQAVYDCLVNNTNFVIDKSREVFLYTQHSDGFLRRER
ncbi:hypothetical protein Vafri_1239 [Volvox africanus]|nr:hypothetical protein Vafri_1239 [Volvox africanus]